MSSQLDYEALHDQDNPRQDFERSAAHILRYTIAQEYPNSWWMSISPEKALFRGRATFYETGHGFNADRLVHASLVDDHWNLCFAR